MDAGTEQQIVDWGAAALTLPGESQAGDRHLVVLWPTGALIAAIDGLGHGEIAAAAAQVAAEVLQTHAPEPVLALFERCHAALRGTRGVVMSLASFDAHHRTMAWLGVGNVTGVLLHRGMPARETLTLRAGVVGDRLPILMAESIAILPGDLLVFATDGVRDSFADGRFGSQTPSAQRIADRILDQFASRKDDALVVAVRYLGVGEEKNCA